MRQAKHSCAMQSMQWLGYTVKNMIMITKKTNMIQGDYGDGNAADVMTKCCMLIVVVITLCHNDSDNHGGVD